MENGHNRENEVPVETRWWQVWLETLVISAVVPAMGRWLAPADPFFLAAPVSWAVLAPLLVGLRHGSVPGLGSAALLIGCVAVARQRGWVALPEFPAQLSLALLIVGLLAGEFSDLWNRRQRRVAAMVEYHRTRLEEFSRSYQVIKASHDMLQQEVAADPQSLRDALASLKKRLVEARNENDISIAGQTILSLFADFGRVQVASLFWVEQNGELSNTRPIRIGEGSAVDVGDPMIQAALRGKRVVSIGAEFRGREGETDLLAAIPLCDVSDRVWGLVAVREMLFTAFQGETLRLLSVMAGHMGDILAFRNDAPDGEQFAREIRRALVDGRRFGLHSSVVRITAKNEERFEVLFRELMTQRRGLDRALTVANGGTRSLLMLLPLTDEAGLDRYKERLQGMLKARMGTDVGEADLKVVGGVLESEKGAAELVGPLDASLAA
jgi:hypothetical protein